GVQYAKGLGTNAKSEINYALNGQYTWLLTDVGVDDEAAPYGTVTFEIWVYSPAYPSGTRAWASGMITGKGRAVSARVDVTNAKSRIKYAPTAKYTTFTTDVGVDDEANASGTVTFEIWVYSPSSPNGTRVWTSGVVTGKVAAVSVTVDVTNATSLRLVVGDAG